MKPTIKKRSKRYYRLYDLARFYRDVYKINFNLIRCKIPCDGDCCLDFNDKFTIRIKNNLSENFAIDVLIHEVAHCISWCKEKNDHGPIWGGAYGNAYRKYLIWNEKI